MKYAFVDTENTVVQIIETEPASGKTAEDLRTELEASSGKTVIVTDDPLAVCGAVRDGESFAPPTPPAPALDLDISADKEIAAVGEAVNVTARLLVHGTDTVAPLDHHFAVPVEDAEGAVAMIKGVVFTKGVASVTLTFAKSGYYRITEAGINRKLPPGQQIGFPRVFEVTVYE